MKIFYYAALGLVALVLTIITGGIFLLAMLGFVCWFGFKATWLILTYDDEQSNEQPSQRNNRPRQH